MTITGFCDVGAYKTRVDYSTILADDALVTILRRCLVSQKTRWRIKTYLLNHKISEDFKPQGRAPDTESQAMIPSDHPPEQCSVEI